MKRLFTLSEKVHGQGHVQFTWQRPQSNFIATAGVTDSVNIFDRHGDRKQQINLQGGCVGLGWDKDGDVLAAIDDKTSQIVLWDANNCRLSKLDIGFKDSPSILLWSKVSSYLAVGTSKGNLLIYDHRSSRKVPIVGKHTKRISCGCWSEQDLLALAGDDKILTISNHEGDTIRQLALRAEPHDVQFSEMKQNERLAGENTVSLVIGKKTLFLYNLSDPENPIELAFQQKYGNIITYKWFGDGYVLLGFSHGYFVAISTHMKEIGQELFQTRNHKGGLTSLAVNNLVSKAASCGDNTVKIHEISDLKETYAVITVDDEQAVDGINWTEDGQLLAISTPRGNVHVYLSKLPILGDTYNTKLIYLTSLVEVTIVDYIEKEKALTINANVEPSFLCLGPYHFALGMNNRAWFYAFTENGPQLLGQKEYLGTIQNIRMNADYACALYEGKLHLHLIDGELELEGRETRIFPDNSDLSITSHSMTNDCLIYSTSCGTLCYFLLEDWQVVNEFQHPTTIKSIFSESSGVQLIFVDDKSDGFIYNPLNDNAIEIPEMTSKAKGVLWDKSPSDKDTFVVYDDDKIYTYVYERETIKGTKILYVGSSVLPTGQFPLLLYGGELTCQTQGGKTANMTLMTHDLGSLKSHNFTKEEAKNALNKCLILKRFKEAWSVCQLYDFKELWTMLGKAALENLDIDTATLAYRQVNDVSMVYSLEGLIGVEDQSLLSGHVAMMLGDFDIAQDLYLSSSCPSAALDMRRDLMQWNVALRLANKLAPEQVAFISKEYAQQLEFTGEYSNALTHYEKGVLEVGEEFREHNEACHAGIARTAIRCGDIRRGIGMAERLPGRTLQKECADILESMKQFAEASVLFEKSGYYDKAASLYIRLKNWQKIGELLPNLTSPKILLQYAKAKEADGRYKEAADAYRQARDFDNLIRVQLDYLKNPEEAVRLVKETQSIEGAKMVARFFQNLNDYPSAIQFLVMSKCNDEAFQLAHQYGKMSIYTDVVGSSATQDQFRSVAYYYENERSHFQAGKFYYLAKDYSKALKHLLKASDKEEKVAVQLATDVVGEAGDIALTQQLIGYLLGETDGVPKDAKYLFRLYMSCKKYNEAAKTAVIIAREEQNAGNYRNAHDMLFSMHQELRKHNIKIPSEMNSALMILHSYILVKIHVKRGDHLKGARMLIRVANNISKFPSHVVPILTSTIIECHRSGLKNSSFSYATMLLRPEYKNQIDVKYKKKIEAIVRKPQRTEEEEDSSPCPYCDNSLAETELFCQQCKNNLPYCIITGQHVVVRDLTRCPKCRFPAIMSEFIKHLELDLTCPMCSEETNVRLLEKLTDAKSFLYSNSED